MRWTKEEVEWLRENYYKVSKKELSNHLGRNLSTIRVRANQEDITKPRKFWTPKKTKVLSEKWVTETNKEIADYFGRSIGAIKCQAAQMGLRKSDKASCKIWSNAEDFILEVTRDPQKAQVRIYNETKKKRSIKEIKHRLSTIETPTKNDTYHKKEIERLEKKLKKQKLYKTLEEEFKKGNKCICRKMSKKVLEAINLYRIFELLTYSVDKNGNYKIWRAE